MIYQSRGKLATILIIGGLCLVPYYNSLGCELVHDDIFAIKENADVKPRTPLSNLLKNDFWGKSMSDNTSHKSYRPLTVLTFRMNYILHGLHPFGYHATNVVLHFIVSLTFLCFCQENVFQDVNLSLAAAALFATHSIHTEAVTGVVGRADVLSCLLFLYSLVYYFRIMKQEKMLLSVNNNNKPTYVKRPKYWRYLIATAILSSLAMLCKENGITSIGVCIFIDIMQHKDELLSTFHYKLGREKDSLKRLFMRLMVLITTAIVLLAFRLYIMNGQLPAFNEEDNPASFAPNRKTRFMMYCYLCAFNVWLLLFPNCLSYDWQIGSIPLVESFSDVRNCFSLIVFICFAVLFLTAMSRKDNAYSQHVTLVGLALLVIPFLPASNLFFRVGFVVAERILYIPSMGYCILVAHGLRILLELRSEPVQKNEKSDDSSTHVDLKRRDSRHTSIYQRFLQGAFSFIIILLILRTIQRNKVWKDRETLFRSGVEILPHNAKVHYNYANFLKDSNKTDEAIKHYKISVKLYPKHASSHNNLATLLGDSDEAEYHFKQTLIHNPYHYKAMYNLANLYRKKRRHKEAKYLLERSLRLKPEYIDAVQVLAETFHDLGETEKGQEIFYQASLKSNDGEFFNNYGVFLANIGDGESSLKAYQKATELQPNQKVFLINYGRQLKSMSRFEEAENIYRRSLKLRRDPTTLHLLGVLLYQTKRLKESELAFLEALKYEPLNADNIRNHATAVFEQGHQNEAVKLLKDAFQVLPKSAVIAKTMASFLMTLLRQKEALDVISSGLKSNMNDPELHSMRANAFRELNNLDLALESFKDVLRLDPNNFGALQNIGVIYHLKGFKVEAKHYYNKALAIDPSNKVLKDNIAKLLRTM